MTAFARTDCPHTSPWGPIQHCREYGPGVWSVSTAGHGGFMLSPARNAAVHPSIRDDRGHYEEDCAWAVVAFTFPDLFTEEHQGFAKASMINWYPDQFEAITGDQILSGCSSKRNQQEFDRANAGRWISGSAFGSWASFVQPGEVGVCASRTLPGGKVESAWFIIPEDEYEARDRYGFVIDPARHVRVAAPVNAWAKEKEERILIAA